MTATPVEFTVQDGQTSSEWKAPLNQYGPPEFRLLSLETDANCPPTTLTVSVRDPGDQVIKSVPSFLLNVDANQAFGASSLAELSSLLDGREWRITLAAAPTGNSVVTLRAT